MRKPRFNKYQVGMMIAVPVAITTNPLTIEIFLEWYKWAFAGISAVCVIYIIGFMLYSMFKPDKPNIPSKKTKKKSTQKYIDYDPES